MLALLAAGPVAASQDPVSVAQLKALALKGTAQTATVRGVVTRHRPGRSVFITDPTGNLFINIATNDAGALAPGDIIQATGVAAVDEFAPFLDSAAITRTGTGPAPRPLDTPVGVLLSGVHDAGLVRLEAELVDVLAGRTEHSLRLRADGSEFLALLLATRAGNLADLRPGSVLQVTGICSVQVRPDGRPAGFELLLRDAGDVRVVDAASWWTPGRVWRLLLVAGAALVLALASVVALRRQVRRQTRALAERLRAEEALAAQYEAIFDNATDMIYTHDPDGRMTSLNVAGERMTGYTRDQSALLTFWDFLVPEDARAVRDQIDTAVSQHATAIVRARLRTRDGRVTPVEIHARPVFAGGRPATVEGVARDLTARERFEDELREAQKMEAVGRLAAGIAHDFNNLLTVVLAYSDFLASRLPDEGDERQAIAEIQKAAARAASLTAQMVAFGRRQFLAPTVIDLGEIVRALAPLIDRAVGDEVVLTAATPETPLPVLIDRAQLEQALINLAVNARDAMPSGGRLKVAASHWRIADPESAADSQHPALTPGEYARLVVSDTGIGIPPEVQRQIFEPFYSTRGGTGLGLAMVHGFVKQSGGHILVRSATGEGTTFELLFPLARHAEPIQGATTRPAVILVVEDDPPVRRLMVESLTQNGFEVLEAADGEQARDIVNQRREPIDLLLTDLRMPRLGGVELARWLAEHRPGMRLLFMSGYAAPPAVTEGMFGPQSFLQKPFTRDTLLARIRELLAASRLSV